MSSLGGGADGEGPGFAGATCGVGEGDDTSRCIAWPKVGTAAIPLQASPSVETSSLPRSCPSSSIFTMTPGSNGPKTFPLLRRTW
jgi:hypothetical protein